MNKTLVMKTFLAAAVLIIAGCTTTKEINVELVSAQLIRIDTVFRESNNPKQVLTWRDKDNIQYISFTTMDRTYPVGTVLNMLRPR